MQEVQGVSPHGVRCGRRHADVWVRTWRTIYCLPLLNLFYFLGFGFGVGAHINEMGGVSYVEYIAPSFLQYR